MTDTVTIKLTADTADLQRNLQNAAASVNTTTAVLRGGAAQIAASFGSISAHYATSAAARLQSAKQASDDVVAIERQQENSRYQIAQNGLRMNQALVKAQVQTAQLNHEQELSALLGLEGARAAIEQKHLATLQSAYHKGSAQYEAYQAKLETLTTQSALRREQLELHYNRQVYSDYRRTFDQIASSVSSALMGMIEGHENLRQASRKILLGIVQDFIQARLRMAAEWAAGVASEAAVTQTGEAAKTAAVVSGVAARTAAEAGGAASNLAASAAGMVRQIVADARAAFAGVFAFLAPVMGPAAAGPAAAAMGTVTAMASFDAGAWQLPADMVAQVHRGEMIVPAGATPWAQSVMASAASASASGVTLNHATHFNVTAMDSQDVSRWFKANGKMLMRTINDSVRYGAHLGMGKLT